MSRESMSYLDFFSPIVMVLIQPLVLTFRWDFDLFEVQNISDKILKWHVVS